MTAPDPDKHEQDAIKVLYFIIAVSVAVGFVGLVLLMASR